MPIGVYVRTEKYRMQISKIMRNRVFSKSHRENLNRSLVGRYWKLSDQAKRNIGNGQRGRKKTESHKYKIGISVSKSLAGRKLSKSHIEKIRRRAIGNKSRTGYKNTKSHNEKISASLIGNKRTLGYIHSDQLKKKLSKINKKRWEDPEYKERMLKKLRASYQCKPNRVEKLLFGIVEELVPFQYKLNVTGDIILNGKIPDIVNINGQKKCIELFGDYWHKGENINDRIGLFKNLGWECLIIWEHELKDLKRVKEKLLCFFDREIYI